MMLPWELPSAGEGCREEELGFGWMGFKEQWGEAGWVWSRDWAQSCVAAGTLRGPEPTGTRGTTNAIKSDAGGKNCSVFPLR